MIDQLACPQTVVKFNPHGQKVSAQCLASPMVNGVIVHSVDDNSPYISTVKCAKGHIWHEVKVKVIK